MTVAPAAERTGLGAGAGRGEVHLVDPDTPHVTLCGLAVVEDDGQWMPDDTPTTCAVCADLDALP